MHSELIGLHYLTVAREHMKHKSRRADETERTKQFISDKGGKHLYVSCAFRRALDMSPEKHEGVSVAFSSGSYFPRAVKRQQHPG